MAIIDITNKSMDDIGKMMFEILVVVICRNFAPEEAKAIFSTLKWMVDEVGPSNFTDEEDEERVRAHYIVELGKEIGKRRIYKSS